MKITSLLAPLAVGSVAGLLVGFLAPGPGPGVSARPAPAVAARTALVVAVRPAAPPVPVLSWRSCDGSFQCATARVPLDYRRPRGATISIAVVRHLATDPAHRVGTLFVNGGGPSEQIDGFLASYATIPAALRARYDILSFDPRGFGYSTAVRCFPTAAAETRFLAGLPVFPVGARQDAAWEHTWARFDARCAQRNGSLLAHDTTADVARDMNLLRQAVGDPVLNYVGLSYGSGLGATYANLFPASVGHMVLDANVNPVTWTTDDDGLPVFLRLHTDQASAAVMTDFLDLCGKAPAAACAFSAGTPAATRTKFATLLHRLLRHPVTIGSPPQAYTYADAIGSVPLGTVRDWQRGAILLQHLWTASAAVHRASGAGGAPALTAWGASVAVHRAFGAGGASSRTASVGGVRSSGLAADHAAASGPAAGLGSAAPSGDGGASALTGWGGGFDLAAVDGAPFSAGGQAPSAAGLASVYTGQEQTLAVLCGDTANPRGLGAYAAAARLAEARAGGFGLLWTWQSEACAQWPRAAAQDRYTGPWNRWTASPVLLLANTGDPALPYQDSVAMSHDLARARLLTVDGYGHTEESNPSTCAIRYEVGYLLTGALPPAGTVCQQNGKPFPSAAPLQGSR